MTFSSWFSSLFQPSTAYASDYPMPAPMPSAQPTQQTTTQAPLTVNDFKGIGRTNPIYDAGSMYNSVSEMGPYKQDSGSNSGGQVLETQDNTPAQQDQGPSMDQLLNDVFNPTFNYLNQAEQVAKSQQPGVEQDILNQYGTSKTNLEGERTSGMNQIGQSEQSTFNRKEDAASAARRLYDELSRGGRQRFGGASSAGQAYGELTAAEQQRRMGGIQTQFNEAMGKLDLAKNDLTMKFTTALSELENQKNSALNDARRFFQDKLLEISRMRGQAESDKANARLQELQNLRNTVYQINMQDYQYKQQLAANKQANESAVEQARQRLLQSVGMGSQAYQQFLGNSTVNPTTGLTMGYTPTAQNQAFTGQIARRPEDQMLAGITTPTQRTDEFGNPIA